MVSSRQSKSKVTLHWLIGDINMIPIARYLSERCAYIPCVSTYSVNDRPIHMHTKMCVAFRQWYCLKHLRKFTIIYYLEVRSGVTVPSILNTRYQTCFSISDNEQMIETYNLLIPSVISMRSSSPSNSPIHRCWLCMLNNDSWHADQNLFNGYYWL